MGLTGGFVVEMGVRAEIRAVAGRPTLEVDRADEVALDEGFETIVDGGEGDAGQLGLYPGEDFVGGGVVALLQEDVVNELALGSGAQAAVGQFLREPDGEGGGLGCGSHDFEEGATNWNDSKVQAIIRTIPDCGQGTEVAANLPPGALASLRPDLRPS